MRAESAGRDAAGAGGPHLARSVSTAAWAVGPKASMGSDQGPPCTLTRLLTWAAAFGGWRGASQPTVMWAQAISTPCGAHHNIPSEWSTTGQARCWGTERSAPAAAWGPAPTCWLFCEPAVPRGAGKRPPLSTRLVASLWNRPDMSGLARDSAWGGQVRRAGAAVASKPLQGKQPGRVGGQARCASPNALRFSRPLGTRTLRIQSDVLGCAPLACAAAASCTWGGLPGPRKHPAAHLSRLREQVCFLHRVLAR